jgi:hypothetical protein
MILLLVWYIVCCNNEKRVKMQESYVKEALDVDVLITNTNNTCPWSKSRLQINR